MTENDYILATNIARIQVAVNAIRDTSPDNTEEGKKRAEILEGLMVWKTAIEKKVNGEIESDD
jgi:hypothetical protein